MHQLAVCGVSSGSISAVWTVRFSAGRQFAACLVNCTSTRIRPRARENRFEVGCFPVFHRIECWGFCFREVRPLRRVNPEKARQHEVPSSFFERLKWGENYQGKNGAIIENEWVTEPAAKARSYAYAADTRFDERIIRSVQGVDLLYHETTYLNELEERAEKRFHSTAGQAATVAREAGVQRLIIGHFSSKYEKLDVFEMEARQVFPHTDLALEGVTYRI